MTTLQLKPSSRLWADEDTILNLPAEGDRNRPPINLPLPLCVNKPLTPCGAAYYSWCPRLS